MKMNKYILLITTIVIIIFSGCLENNKTTSLEEITVGLSWIHEAQYAGYYWADQYGFYENEGLNVTFIPYNYEDLTQNLINDKYDFVFLQTDTFLLSIEEGYNITAIFADYQLMPTVYFSKVENNITKPIDLINKTVGVAYSERYPLVAMLASEGINLSSVNIVERTYDYNWLLNDTYDVEAGWITDGLLVKNIIGNYNVIRPYEYGINWYADILVTTNDMISNYNEIVEKFIRASYSGWINSIEHVEEAALLTKRYSEEYTDEHFIYVLESSYPLIHTGENYIGWIDKKTLDDAITILYNQGILQTQISSDNIFTNEFINP